MLHMYAVQGRAADLPAYGIPISQKDGLKSDEKDPEDHRFNTQFDTQFDTQYNSPEKRPTYLSTYVTVSCLPLPLVPGLKKVRFLGSMALDLSRCCCLHSTHYIV